MKSKDLAITVAALSWLLIAAVASLWIPVSEPPPAEPSSAFIVDSKQGTIRIPEAATRRIGLEAGEIRPVDEPVVARFTARTGFNLERTTHVKAQFPGKIVDIGPALGSRVLGPGGLQPPTVLCVVESVDLGNAKNTYQRARVQLELDEEALERTRQMVAEKVMGPKFLLDAEAAVRKDLADLEAARQNLFVFGVREGDLDRVFKETRTEKMAYEISAPLSGTIAEKNVTRGEFADNSVNLFTIADTSMMWIWGWVYEKDWGKVKVGQKMKVVLAAYPDRPLESVVDFVSPEIDGATRSIMIRGTVDNTEGHILADMYGTLLVTVDDGQGSLIVPSNSVVRDLKADRTYLFVRRDAALRGTGLYERVPVEVKPVDAGRFRVTKGLRPGERVVTRGALNLFEEMGGQP
jgi:RND family efflux transporter MFP subunit